MSCHVNNMHIVKEWTNIRLEYFDMAKNINYWILTSLDESRELLNTLDSNKITLIFDLDGTLIDGGEIEPIIVKDFWSDLSDFIEANKDSFNVLLWSAGVKEHVSSGINKLYSHTKNNIFDLIISRGKWFYDGYKNLTKLVTSLDKVILFDDCSINILGSPENSILIKNFKNINNNSTAVGQLVEIKTFLEKVLNYKHLPIKHILPLLCKSESCRGRIVYKL